MILRTQHNSASSLHVACLILPLSTDFLAILERQGCDQFIFKHQLHSHLREARKRPGTSSVWIKKWYLIHYPKGTLPFCFGEFPLGHCTISMVSSTSWKDIMDSSASHQSLHHRSRFDEFTFILRLPRIAPADDPLVATLLLELHEDASATLQSPQHLKPHWTLLLHPSSYFPTAGLIVRLSTDFSAILERLGCGRFIYFTATLEKLGNEQEHLQTLPFCFDEFPLGHYTISMGTINFLEKGRMDSSASHQSLHHRSRFDEFSFTLRLPILAPADDPL
ncbi:hypothetical protein F2Q70_00026643 [Brassica cretica]|uniref:Uncharacterized protein n=1 Tax=Brassica cretica TaxID=69181 RepID=A0A8S9LF28_BRACR|nr:hypothetical protein F2Q70_00026643 [Brassica cretica]